MSKIDAIFEMDNAKGSKNLDPEVIAGKRLSYGIPLDMTNEELHEEGRQMDKNFCVKSGATSIEGMNFALTAIDLLRGAVEPRMISIKGLKGEAVDIVEPMYFKLGGAGLDGFCYVVEEFFTAVDNIETVLSTMPDAKKICEPTAIFKTENKEGLTTSALLLPQEYVPVIYPKENIQDPAVIVFDIPPFFGLPDLATIVSEA